MREMKPDEVMATLFSEATDLRAKLQEAEAANDALRATLRSVRNAVRGGNAIETTAGLLRLSSSRFMPKAEDRNVPTARIFEERANFLEWADAACHGALYPHPKPEPEPGAAELFQSERISEAQVAYDQFMEDAEEGEPEPEVRAFEAMKAAIARADQIALTGRVR